MAERPVFIPRKRAWLRYRGRSEHTMGVGLCTVQKKKNVKALHDAAASNGLAPLLEISTKSDVVAGQHLSAFYLKVKTEIGEVPLECAYQGSKVFEGKRGPIQTSFKSMRGPRSETRACKHPALCSGSNSKGIHSPSRPRPYFMIGSISTLYIHTGSGS